MNIETIRYFIVNNFITIALLITLFLIFIFRKKITDIIMKKVPDNYLMVLALFIICFVFVYYGFDFYHRNIINGDQLSYMGSIIGGGITLLGVYLTINYEKQTRKEDQIKHDQERKSELSLLYMPIISVSSTYEFVDKLCSEIRLYFDNKQFDNNSLYTIPCKIVLKNSGRGEATKLFFKDIEINVIESCPPIENIKYSIIGDGSFNFLAVNDSNYLKILIPNFVSTIDIFDITLQISMNLHLTRLFDNKIDVYLISFYLHLLPNIKTQSVYGKIDELNCYYSGNNKY
ncbi:MAG: hypothetical protein UJ210_00610 [Massilimicrobiota sp.]|nr:hypothetical protein [Massilimicrobiota sp.]